MKNSVLFNDLRPSRIILWILLSNDLKKLKFKCKNALDAASASFYTFPLFNKLDYIGIDLDEKRICQGMKGHKNCKGVVGDLKNINFKPNSFDICVSTNTLYKLDIADRNIAIKNLISYIRKGGYLLVQLPVDNYYEASLEMLSINFRHLRTYYHGHRITKSIEKRFVEVDGFATKNEFNQSIVYFMIKCLLACFEMLTLNLKTNKVSVYVRCYKKIS